jgi:hypothetical protein
MVELSGAVWSRWLAYQQERICRSALRLGGRVTCDNEPVRPSLRQIIRVRLCWSDYAAARGMTSLA